MRAFFLALIFVGMSLGGCISDTPERVIPETATKPGEEDTGLDSGFEPIVEFKANSVWLEKGETVELTFSISDLEDYPYPLDFVDWNLTYSREPNPVAEGSAFNLPGNYSRTLFAEAYHQFVFAVSDGQGFEEKRSLLIKVGNPAAGEVIQVEAPSAGTCSTAVCEAMSIDVSTQVESTCGDGCNLAAASGRTPMPCSGLHTRENGIDCFWVSIPFGAAGTPFTVTSTLGDPEVIFTDYCGATAETIESVITGGAEEGSIPEGARCLITWEYAGSPSTITVHVDPFLGEVSGYAPYIYELRNSRTLWRTTGCVEEERHCDGMMAGPYSSIVDGRWVMLDERYWGASTSTAGLGPSADAVIKCYFMDRMLNVIGNGQAGGGNCAGRVPEGTMWMFLFANRAVEDSNGSGWTLDFGLDAAQVDASKAKGMPVAATYYEDYGIEDRGSYYFDMATSQCHVKNFIQRTPGREYQSFGTWFFAETNDIPGLQADADDLAGNAGVGEDCVNGDLTYL